MPWDYPQTGGGSTAFTGSGHGTHAARPAANAVAAGFAYWETDTLTLFVSDGAATWTLVGPGGSLPAGGSVGQILINTAPATATWQNPNFVNEVSAPDYKNTGLTGAVAVARWVGATTGGAPASGTFQLGDYVIDKTGNIFVCTVAGTPGTWTAVGNGSHGAEYTFTGFSLTNSTALNPTGAVWTSISDTDNYGTTLAASGFFTIPAGLGGRHVVTATVNYPAAAYTLIFTEITNTAGSAVVNPGQRQQSTFTNAIQVQMAAYTGALAAAATPGLTMFQTSGGAVSVSGSFQITRVGN